MSSPLSARRFAALFSVLVAGAAVLVAPSATAAPDLATTVRATMLQQHGDALKRQWDTQTLREPLFEPTRTSDAWVFGSTTVPLAHGQEHGAPHMALFLARKERSTWRVELDGTAGFAALAAQAPSGVLSDGEKRTFAANQSNQALAPTGLGLPWPVNVAWWMGGGPHGNSGNSRPFSSIDFNGGDGRVLSAGNGRVYKSCVVGRSALVKVVHDNGYSTTYYHMYNLTTLADGSAVRTGTYLGNIGNELPCGGSSTGAHVHFSLLRGNTHVSVNGMTIGGWTFYEGSQAYGGYAQRGSTRVNVGGRITNYGGGGTTLPTGTVDAGPNTTVNLRSGPGLSYSVAGTVADGATVSIACASRGEAVEGVWGPTDLWNRLEDGKWISDGFADTGSNEPVAPAC
ncbi:peptidoglycan DD-metalloendopeptidase family protein [Lentzea sp. NBC_00516]|uniref:peptidoglycan DD-metalloendopeptidase family protein n=1 Tax=Lentzea sp. NBC_00516 TaxID=2903582 RepID=UPI002E81A368|nr:peptidoglycan DD-metalloendopeptidase family protein [Lentzea sp. NBC_00516]WUD28457.1 peptidoglycan DD-metalloendopeptidase family protein [Lentzea sp. NBC_00516]